MEQESPLHPPPAHSSEPSSSSSAAQRRRRRILEQAQAKARAVEQAKIRALHRKQVARGVWKNAGKALDKINVAKWIDDLERDQELADELDRINAETAEEQERKAICRQATEECMQAIRDHLASFVEENPGSTYEEWIREIHPDNVSQDNETIDARFYVEKSDHRQMWNESITPAENGEISSRKPVPSRAMILPVAMPIDKSQGPATISRVLKDDLDRLKSEEWRNGPARRNSNDRPLSN